MATTAAKMALQAAAKNKDEPDSTFALDLFVGGEADGDVAVGGS